MADDRVILLAGGGTVYVFRPDQADTAAQQRAVLDVAYPADEPEVRTVTADRWEQARAKLAEDNPEIQIVDLRES